MFSFFDFSKKKNNIEKVSKEKKSNLNINFSHKVSEIIKYYEKNIKNDKRNKNFLKNDEEVEKEADVFIVMDKKIFFLTGYIIKKDKNRFSLIVREDSNKDNIYISSNYKIIIQEKQKYTMYKVEVEQIYFYGKKEVIEFKILQNLGDTESKTVENRKFFRVEGGTEFSAKIIFKKDGKVIKKIGGFVKDMSYGGIKICVGEKSFSSFVKDKDIKNVFNEYDFEIVLFYFGEEIKIGRFNNQNVNFLYSYSRDTKIKSRFLIFTYKDTKEHFLNSKLFIKEIMQIFLMNSAYKQIS